MFPSFYHGLEPEDRRPPHAVRVQRHARRFERVLDSPDTVCTKAVLAEPFAGQPVGSLVGIAVWHKPGAPVVNPKRRAVLGDEYHGDAHSWDHVDMGAYEKIWTEWDDMRDRLMAGKDHWCSSISCLCFLLLEGPTPPPMRAKLTTFRTPNRPVPDLGQGRVPRLRVWSSPPRRHPEPVRPANSADARLPRGDADGQGPVQEARIRRGRHVRVRRDGQVAQGRSGRTLTSTDRQKAGGNLSQAVFARPLQLAGLYTSSTSNYRLHRIAFPPSAISVVQFRGADFKQRGPLMLRSRRGIIRSIGFPSQLQGLCTGSSLLVPHPPQADVDVALRVPVRSGRVGRVFDSGLARRRRRRRRVVAVEPAARFLAEVTGRDHTLRREEEGRSLVSAREQESEPWG